MIKKQLPVPTTTVKADQVVALPGTSSTVAEAIAILSAELQQAIAQMNADDIRACPQLHDSQASRCVIHGGSA